MLLIETMLILGAVSECLDGVREGGFVDKIVRLKVKLINRRRRIFKVYVAEYLYGVKGIVAAKIVVHK